MGSFPVLSFWHLLWNDLGVVEGKYWRDRYGWKCGNVLSHSLLEHWWVPTRMGLPGFYNSGISLSSLFVSSKEGWQSRGPTITSVTVLMLGPSTGDETICTWKILDSNSVGSGTGLNP